jgi:hypothetical protein
MIGTDITGMAAVPNNYFGILGGSLIGGTDPGAGNLVSGTTVNSTDGNSGDGVESDGVIEGNFIGTDITGTKTIGNQFCGVLSGRGTIGSTTAAARNVIAGNGIDVRAGNGAVVEGNFLGLDVTGEVLLTQGLAIQPGGATVGGTAPGAGNLIAGGAVAVYDPTNSVFEGNTIGTNKEGTAHLGGRSFFLRETTGGNTVGGTAAGAGNFISGGIDLIGPSVTGNVFQGNTIDGRLGFNDGAYDNLIGGTTPGAGNVFLSDGVLLIDDASSPGSIGNAILGNSFVDSATKPITLKEAFSAGYVPDVGAVNDSGDADTGPNGAQNYPVITSSYAGPSSIAIGTFNSTPGDTFRIEFYASPAGGAAGQGGGLRYLGFTTVTTDANGNASFTATGLGDSAVGEEIDATATVLTGPNANSTSEFSSWEAAAPLPRSSLSGVVFSDFNHDGQVDFGEAGLPGVTVNLDGTDLLGNPVHLSQTTDTAGTYVFQNLLPGSYTVTAPQVPAGYTAGVNLVGTGGGTISGATFTVSLTAGEDAMNYNYGDQPADSGSIGEGQTAGIGFWNNKNGQALIKGLNGGVGTQLGDWLATTFPHMFGSLSGSNDLAGKSNAYIASFFQSRFVVHGQKLDAQVLATALAVYVTDPSLDNTGIGTTYGFVVSGNGLATSTINVGGDGAAFGVANNTTMTVMDILMAADAQAVNGVLYNGNTTKRNQANDLFSAINEAGG